MSRIGYFLLLCTAPVLLCTTHVLQVSGVLLTKRDTWLPRALYMQLVYMACRLGGGQVWRAQAEV